MMDDKQLLATFSKNLSRFFANTNIQRDEIYRSYDYRDGNQIYADDFEGNGNLRRSLRSGKTYCIVNICAPLVRAVAGSEVMAPSTLDFLSTDPEFDVDADIIDSGVEWCQYISGYRSERGIATEDAATCGLGATVTYLDMTRKGFIAGVPITERVFPGFMFYDNSPRGSLLNAKAGWCGYADPVDAEWLVEYVDDNTNKRTASGGGEYKDYLLSFSRMQNMDEIGFIYHYFWHEYVTIYDAKNPFIGDSPISQAILNDPDVANIIGKLANDLQIDWQAQYWSLDADQFKELKNSMELIQLLLQDIRFDELESSQRKGKCYYRAEVALGKLIKKSRSYTQDGFPLNFITGYYEESSGTYYGLMRPVSHIQDYLNTTTSDFMAYVKAASHGGSAWVEGAGEAFERIKKDRINEDDITPVPKGVVITPKALPNAPEVLLSAINFFVEIMPRTLGLGQEFFGVITSGDMTQSLYGKVMKQSYAVLENWKNNAAGYDLRQGKIYEDLLRLMAEANDGMILPILSDNDDPQAFMRLSKQSLARNYAIRIIPRPLTADERQETFNQLTQLMPTMPPEVQRTMLPAIIKYSNLDFKDKQEFIAAANPPPPQPDPQNQATIQSTIDFTNASAAKAMADAERTKAETQRLIAKAPVDMVKAEADIEKTISETAVNESKIQQAVHDMGNQIFERLANIEQRIAERPTAAY